ncbi:MAG: hypothetical protein ACK4NR_04275 [Micavibrio sp.]
MVEVVSANTEQATLKQPRARTFTFGAAGGLQSIDSTPRERTINAGDAARLGQVREEHNPGSHEIFETAGAKMRTAALHAAGQSLTGPEATPQSSKPAVTFKPDKPGS